MYGRKLFALMCTALVALIVAPSAVFGQAETGTMTGTVHDPSGAVVPGATITIKNVSTGAQRTAQSGNVGQYNIAGLPVGTYEVTIASSGFAQYKTNAEITVGGIATVDATLATGTASTVVEVVAGAGGTEVNTQTQELSQFVSSEQIAQLPSLTRNAYDFIQISGNVSGGDNTTPNTTGSQNLTGRGTGFSINGQRESGTEILLDGVENIDLFNSTVGQNVPVDSVQEYRVITNNFDAQYGRASGGVVNVATKSGTNSLHGSLWEFNRLSAYTANTYDNSVQNTLFRESGGTGPLPAPKGGYTRNQFGFAVGGPIVKDKLFFYGSSEWTRVRSSSLQTEETLNPAFISLLPTNIQNYFATYGTGAFPASGTVTAGALGIGNGALLVNGTTPIPAGTPVFDIVNFRAPFDAGGGSPQNSYSLVGRLDFNMTDKTQMFFRFGRENLDEFLGTASYSLYPQYDVGTGTSNNSGLFTLNHTFGAAALSSTKLSFSRLYTANTFDTSLTNTPNLMLFGFPSDPVTGNLIQFPGLENTAPGLGGLPFGGPQNTSQFEEDLALSKGKHSMRIGGQFTYIQLNKAYGAYAQAVEQLGTGFDNGMASLVNAPGNPNGSPLITFAARVNPNGALPCMASPQYWSTNDPADLITTPGCTVAPPLGSASYARSYRYNDWALYAQDSLKLTPRLTVNYGLRYEHYGVQHNNDQSLDSNFYFGSGNGIYDRVRNGSVQIAPNSPASGFWQPNWGTVAPRVGFALDVFGDGRTSFRGGAGISYERNFGNVTFNASFNPPASAVVTQTCPVGSASCPVVATNNDLGPFATPGPPLPLTPSQIRMPDPHINTAQTQFWSLDIQREIARNTIFDVAYSGAHGVHLYDIENINLVGSGNLYLGDNTSSPLCADTPDGVVFGTNPNLCLTRANNQFSDINMRGSMGTSSYNSLNVRFQTQNIRNTGLALVANYTWAHSLDDLSSTFSDNLQGGSGAIGNLGYTNVLDPKLDWGSSDYDIRHRLVISPVWETPWSKSGKGLATQLIGGWTVSGVFNVRTGIPFSIFDYSDDLNFYTVPRLTPSTSITDWTVNNASQVTGPQCPYLNTCPNLFNILTVPTPAATGPLNPTLGISDFGPYPANMTRRNAFRGPGAWNFDAAIQKTFKLTERVGLTFRAEGFDLLNHHNYYVNTSNLAYFSQGPGATLGTGTQSVTAQKGGLGSLALGGNHDERRFGQFAIRVSF